MSTKEQQLMEWRRDKVMMLDNTADERIRLQALALIRMRECNASRLEMITNGTVVSDALKYVNGKAEKKSGN